MTGDEKARPARLPPGRRPGSAWWLLTKNVNGRAETLVVGRGGEGALAVFSGEGEAEMFFRLGGAFGEGWRIRETSAGELVSILCGPYADVRSVALDPWPGLAADLVGPVGVGRTRFLDRICAAGTKAPARAPGRAPVPSVRKTA